MLALMVVDPFDWRLGLFVAAECLVADGVNEDRRRIADFFELRPPPRFDPMQAKVAGKQDSKFGWFGVKC
jgi:hypothetical protein